MFVVMAGGSKWRHLVQPRNSRAINDEAAAYCHTLHTTTNTTTYTQPHTHTRQSQKNKKTQEIPTYKQKQNKNTQKNRNQTHKNRKIQNKSTNRIGNTPSFFPLCGCPLLRVLPIWRTHTHRNTLSLHSYSLWLYWPPTFFHLAYTHQRVPAVVW